MPIWMLACVAVVTGYLSLMLCSVSGNGKASCLQAFKVCLVPVELCWSNLVLREYALCQLLSLTEDLCRLLFWPCDDVVQNFHHKYSHVLEQSRELAAHA